MPWKGEMTIVSRIVLGSSMVPKCAECWHFHKKTLIRISRISRLDSQVIANSPNWHVFQLHLVTNNKNWDRKFSWEFGVSQRYDTKLGLWPHPFFIFFSILVAYLWRTADPRLRGLRADVPQEPPFLVAWQAVANTHKPPCFWDILIIYPMYHVSINSWLGLIIGIYVYTYTENSNLDLWVQLNAFYWIYGDSTIEIYLASVFFWGLWSDSQGMINWSFGTGEALDQNPFAAIGPVFLSFTNHCIFFRHKESQVNRWTYIPISPL